MNKELPVNWEEIEKACIAGMSFAEAGVRFDVKEDTIRKRAKRNKWPTPLAVVRRVRQLTTKKRESLDVVAESWIEKGEQHRKTAFDLASNSLKKMKAKRPVTWKDADIVDKMARRAAGLENAEVIQQTLVSVNEAIEADEQPVEAYVVDNVLSADNIIDGADESSTTQVV